MDTTQRMAVVLAVLAITGSMLWDAPAAKVMRNEVGVVPREIETPPALSIVAGSEDERASAEWAVARFGEAGLDLPSIVVEFVGPSLDPCGGARARAHRDVDPALVSVCWGSPFVLLHELAHVWEVRSVSSDQQRRFMETRIGVTSWADRNDGWAERGREHAANVIAWGLMEDPSVIGRTYPNDRESLEAGFEILTSRKPLHDSGGEPITVHRASVEREAAMQASALRGGIQSGQ